MTASELQDVLVKRLVRQSGGSPRRWRIVIGPVTIHDLKTHAHCNWSLNTSGGSREVSLVEQLLDKVRLEFPLIVEG